MAYAHFGCEVIVSAAWHEREKSEKTVHPHGKHVANWTCSQNSQSNYVKLRLFKFSIGFSQVFILCFPTQTGLRKAAIVVRSELPGSQGIKSKIFSARVRRRPKCLHCRLLNSRIFEKSVDPLKTFDGKSLRLQECPLLQSLFWVASPSPHITKGKSKKTGGKTAQYNRSPLTSPKLCVQGAWCRKWSSRHEIGTSKRPIGAEGLKRNVLKTYCSWNTKTRQGMQSEKFLQIDKSCRFWDLREVLTWQIKIGVQIDVTSLKKAHIVPSSIIHVSSKAGCFEGLSCCKMVIRYSKQPAVSCPSNGSTRPNMQKSDFQNAVSLVFHLVFLDFLAPRVSFRKIASASWPKAKAEAHLAVWVSMERRCGSKPNVTMDKSTARSTNQRPAKAR